MKEILYLRSFGHYFTSEKGRFSTKPNILKIDEPIVKKVILWGSERDLFTGNIENTI
jgi:hypothetical protein